MAEVNVHEEENFLNLKPKNVFSRFPCILSIQTCSKIYANYICCGLLTIIVT